MELNLWRRCSAISFCFILIVVWANWNPVRGDVNAQEKDCSKPQKLNCDVQALLRFRQKMSQQARRLLKTWTRKIDDEDDDDEDDDGKNYVDPCKWQGVKCTVIPLRKKSFTRVSELQLDRLSDHLNISTQIPEELSNMRFLESLSLYNVGVTGTLPPVLSVLTNLQIFDLASWGIRGTLPPEYSTMRQLQSFHVDYGYLGGTLPAEYSTWNQMKSFGTFSQKVEGSLPREYSTWTQLVEIYLGVNYIEGTLPLEYTALVSVDTIDAFDNNLSGEIPVQYSAINGTVWFVPQTGGLCIRQEYLPFFEKETLATDILDLPHCQQ